jgi:hypothetical protein
MTPRPLDDDHRPDALALDEPPLDILLRRRRASIRSLMGRVEDAVAAPVRSDPRGWLVRVDAEVGGLRAAFDEHLAGTEGPEGYYASLLAEAPRLSAAVRRLVAEHRRMDAAFAAVVAAQDRAGLASDGVDDVREAVVDLLVLFSRHRQHGSDLLWEAYGFDVGGEA